MGDKKLLNGSFSTVNQQIFNRIDRSCTYMGRGCCNLAYSIVRIRMTDDGGALTYRMNR